MNKKYCAIKLSSSQNFKNPSKGGFLTFDKAQRYAEKFICNTCRRDLSNFLKSQRKVEKGILEDKDKIIDLRYKKILRERLPKEQEDEAVFSMLEEVDSIYGDSWPACLCEWFIGEEEEEDSAFLRELEKKDDNRNN